ncbi:unnamed protein product, partial [Tuber aestivum]
MEELREDDRQVRVGTTQTTSMRSTTILKMPDLPFFSFFPFFLKKNSPLLPTGAIMSNMDIIVKRLKKETDLRNGIIKTAKKRKRNKLRNTNSKEIAATPADHVKEMLMRRSCSEKINYKAIEGLFED